MNHRGFCLASAGSLRYGMLQLMKFWRTLLVQRVSLGLTVTSFALMAAQPLGTPQLPPSPPALPVLTNRVVRPTAALPQPPTRSIVPTQVLPGTNRYSGAYSQYSNSATPSGLPSLRPPPLVSRPPEYPYAVPSPDPTYVPGLMMSSPAYGHTAVRQISPVRSGATASVLPSVPARPYSPPKQETVLAWDGLVKEANLKPGEISAHFQFAFTNTSPQEVVVNAVRTSCGCTVAKVPRMPWLIPAGTNATFEVTVDVRGKSGTVTKTVTVDTSAGYRYLTVRASIPAMGGGSMASADRARNLQVALADRQSVLKGDCAVCHVTPGVGKKGGDLYVAVCGVCHEAEHRASMVPLLRALNKPMKAEDWRRVITEGKPDSLMPAFANDHGGPLTPEQIDSLVAYLTGPFQSQPAVVHRVATQSPASAARPATE